MIRGNIEVINMVHPRTRDGLNQADPWGLITDLLEELLEEEYELDLDDPEDDKVPGSTGAEVILLLVKRGVVPS